MERIASTAGVTVSFTRSGGGTPLVLVHGGYSDHHTNWMFVREAWARAFLVVAIARRGRGETSRTSGHRMEDEAADVVAVLESLDEPAFMLGHSYGAHCALLAARLAPDRVRKLVLYEPPWPDILTAAALQRLEQLASAGEWDELAVTFFRDTLLVPQAELDALRRTGHWPPILEDAPASLGDLRAIFAYDFRPEHFAEVRCPVLLQVGSESPRRLYVTDALAAVLPDVRLETLAGQAHEGMTTAPEQYAAAVSRFLMGDTAVTRS